ncbi:MAG: outer membrane protein assembly factor BamA, partial [Bacteroidaceae bacterium]|nr:outer membrane protein assembly factor BamA [Bacteroidaceae bacterium]
MKNNVFRAVAALLMLMASAGMWAQERIVNPEISYAGTPKQYTIGGIAVTGVDGYEDFMLAGISGLSVGDQVEIPGQRITDATKKYWRHGLFSKVSISVDSIVNNLVYLKISLALRPRVASINYIGLKKSERKDMEEKLGLLKGAQITPNMINRAKILAKGYFEDKGYKEAEVEIQQRDDVMNPNQVILDVHIDKHEKMKVKKIILKGNKMLSDRKIKGGLILKGALKKLHETGDILNLFKSKKYTPDRYKEDKQNLIDKYYELGYRDATILADSVWTVDDKHVNVFFEIEEGQKYYIRNITWVGNTVYPADYLSRVLGMKKGDVYNQKLMKKRLSEDDDAVGNNYWNNG